MRLLPTILSIVLIALPGAALAQGDGRAGLGQPGGEPILLQPGAAVAVPPGPLLEDPDAEVRVGPPGAQRYRVPCERCFDPKWMITIDALFLQRSPARSATLVTEAATGRDLLNVSGMDLGVAGVLPRLGILYGPGRDLGIELNHFGIDSWRATHEWYAAGDDLALPLFSGEAFHWVGAEYRSRLFSTEVNLKQWLNDNVNVLVGFRWLELHESFALYGEGTMNGGVDVHTHNHLYGFQLGSEAAVYNPGGAFHIDAMVKAGVYGTSIGEESAVTGTARAFPVTARQGRISFVGELGLTGTYQIGPHWAIRGGYQAMWVEGVALAPDVLTHGPSAIGGAFFHGATVGVETKW